MNNLEYFRRVRDFGRRTVLTIPKAGLPRLDANLLLLIYKYSPFLSSPSANPNPNLNGSLAGNHRAKRMRRVTGQLCVYLAQIGASYHDLSQSASNAGLAHDERALDTLGPMKIRTYHLCLSKVCIYPLASCAEVANSIGLPSFPFSDRLHYCREEISVRGASCTVHMFKSYIHWNDGRHHSSKSS